MAVLQLRFVGDLVLRRKTHAVKKIDASVQRLIDDMIDTMHAAHGVGLAAPQVGRSERVAVIHVPEEEVIVLVNPQIVKRSGERCVEEGCLSVPGYVAEVTRSEAVTVKALDREGRSIRVKATDDMLAQALEHEMDHLGGVLYIDYLESADQLIKLEPREEAVVAEDEA
ncbi:MAG TPA: peptide deformylase [Dehalococcoidia bacterium]|nr:peptide deformylase [Dehalococcoidia bacterium]